ncbi:PAS domain S-box protein [Chloroflexota bacterium]
MRDKAKTKSQLIDELNQMRQKIAELEPEAAVHTLSRNQLNNILDSMKDGVYIVDPEYNLQYANPYLVSLFGTIVNRKCYEYFHNLNKACSWCKSADVFAGHPIHWEWSSPENGRVYDLLDTPLNNSDGTINKLAILRDITERTRTEEELEKHRKHLEVLVNERTAKLAAANDQLRAEISERREAEELFATLAFNSQIGTYIVQDGKFQFTNPAFQRDLGFSEEEMLGVSSLSIVHPEDRKRVRDNAVKMLKGKKSSGYEFRIMAKDGATRWAYEKISSIEYDGKQATLASYMDTTEFKKAQEALQQSERRYRLLADNVTDVIWVRDMHLQLTFISPSILKQTGFTVAESMNRSLEDSLTPDSFDQVTEILAEELAIESTAKKDPTRSRTIIGETICKDGSTIAIETKVSFLRDSDGQPVGIIGVTRDITERIKAEEALRESEERFRTIFESANDEIIYVDKSGIVIDRNRKGEDILGYTMEEVIGKNISDLDSTLPNNQMFTMIQLFRNAMGGTGGRGLTEVEMIHKNGRQVFAQASVSPFKKKGVMEGVLIILRDITKNKQAEEAVRESEEKYRLIAESSTEGIYQVDESGEFLFVNEAYARILGYDREEMIGKHYTMIIPETNIPEAEKIVRDVMSGTPAKGEFYLKHKYGHEIPAYFSMGPIRMPGDLWGFSGIIEDITDRKKAEDALRESEGKFREIFENVNDEIVYLDQNGTIVDLNDRIEDMFGYTRDELVGKNLGELELFSSEDLAEFAAGFNNLLAESVSSESRFLKDFVARRKDGSTVFVESSARFIERDGKPAGLLSVIRDVTERKRAEEVTLQRNRELAALNAVAQTASQSLHMDETLKNAVDKILEVLNTRHGGIYLLDQEEKKLILKVHRGISDSQANEASALGIGDGNVGRVLESKKPLFIESLSNSSEVTAKESLNIVASEQLQSVVLIPLQARGKTLGVMFAATEHDRIFSPEERGLLVTIGHQISTAIENALLYEELQRKEEIRGEVIQQSILAQEEERKRIARELHDQTSQVLTGASAMIEASVAALPYGTDEIKERLRETRVSLTNMLVDVRNIIYELRPSMLDDLGLVAAARWHAEDYLERAGIKAHFETVGRKRKLPAKLETAVFRIIQEATTNIIKHARAKNARIKLEFQKDCLILNIEDDGKGFELQKAMNPTNKKRGMGLLNIKERVEILDGDFRIESQRSRGTKITVSIPDR